MFKIYTYATLDLPIYPSLNVSILTLNLFFTLSKITHDSPKNSNTK